jgi:hypothetical protein
MGFDDKSRTCWAASLLNTNPKHWPAIFNARERWEQGAIRHLSGLTVSVTQSRREYIVCAELDIGGTTIQFLALGRDWTMEMYERKRQTTTIKWWCDNICIKLPNGVKIFNGCPAALECNPGYFRFKPCGLLNPKLVFTNPPDKFEHSWNTPGRNDQTASRREAKRLCTANRVC